MTKSNFDFTFKFFHPPQRTVPVHKGLLDIRTKRMIAQDRLVVEEKRVIDAERRKSETNIQLLAFEQKQIEKKLISLRNSKLSIFEDRPTKMRGRSTSEVIFRNVRRSHSWTETLNKPHLKLTASLSNSSQNLLSIPKINQNQRRFSRYSDGDLPKSSNLTNEIDSSEEDNVNKKLSKFYTAIANHNKAKINEITLPPIPTQQTKTKLPIVSVIPPEEDTLFLIR